MGINKHIAWSVPPLMYSKEFFEQDGGKQFYLEIEALQQQFAKDGFFAGVNILHLERKKHVDDGSECDFKAKWDHGKLTYCEREHKWVWGPHIHFIGQGFFEKSNIVYEQTQGKWTYDNIETTWEDGRDVGATSFYILTHAANFLKIESGKCAKGYRYVGFFKDKCAKKSDIKTYDEKCVCGVDDCEADLHKFEGRFETVDGKFKLVPDVKLENDQGVYVMRTKVETWILKDGVKNEKISKKAD